jgi:hypothetical protein
MYDGTVHIYTISAVFSCLTFKILLKPIRFLSFLCFILVPCVCVCVFVCVWADKTYAMVYMTRKAKVRDSAGEIE